MASGWRKMPLALKQFKHPAVLLVVHNGQRALRNWPAHLKKSAILVTPDPSKTSPFLHTIPYNAFPLTTPLSRTSICLVFHSLVTLLVI
jgi:hypothetical protein